MRNSYTCDLDNQICGLDNQCLPKQNLIQVCKQNSRNLHSRYFLRV